jgi:hypothetical protein
VKFAPTSDRQKMATSRPRSGNGTPDITGDHAGIDRDEVNAVDTMAVLGGLRDQRLAIAEVAYHQPFALGEPADLLFIRNNGPGGAQLPADGWAHSSGLLPSRACVDSLLAAYHRLFMREKAP